MIKSIIHTLSRQAHDAASAGYDHIEWNFDANGTITESDVRDGYLGEAYMDDSDPQNIGWAYRITPIRDGEKAMDQQETGSL